MKKLNLQNEIKEPYLLKEERQSAIMKYAMEHASFSSKEVAHRLKVSSKTIVNDMKQINTAFHGAAKFRGGHGTFELCIYNYDQFQAVSQKMHRYNNYDPSSQRAISIVNFLWESEKPLLIDDLADRMNVSRSTLNVDLKHARGLLKPYHIQIVGKPNYGLQMKGNEFGIRLFAAQNICETYPLHFQFQPNMLAELKCLTDRIELDQTNKERFYNFLCILVDRVTRGHWISILPSQYRQVPQIAAFRFLMPPVVKAVEDLLQVPLPEAEQIFLSLPVIGMHTPVDMKTISTLPVRQDVEILLKEIAVQIHKVLNLDVTWQNLPSDFIYHMDFLMNRLLFNCQVKNPYVNEIIQNYPLPFMMAKIAGQVIEQYYGNCFSITDDELSYIAAYFNTFFLENKMQFNEKCKSVLVCGGGRAIACLVAAQLKKMLRIHSNVDLLSDFEANRETLSQYDVVFTMGNAQSLSSITDRLVISVNPILSGRDITADIERARYVDKLSSPKVKLNALLLNVLPPNCFFTLDEQKSYQENVKFMVSALMNSNLLDSEFYVRLLRREKQGTMIYENGVAFLHTTNKQLNRPILALGVLHNPLYSSEHEVKVIFLLGIQEHIEASNSLIIRIYEEIIRISRSPQIIDKLSHVKTYNECLGVIQEAQKLFTF